MKTPDEIKRGLDFCSTMPYPKECIVGCAYCDEGMTCIPGLMADALAYIRELEARLAELDKRCDANALNATTAIRELEETKLRCLKQIKVYVDKLAEYEKPLKPMTLEEAYEADHCYIEYNTKGSSEPQVILLGMMPANSNNEKRVEIMEFGEDVDYCVKLNCEVYGEEWRCWPRKPTDEERKAVEWDAE